MEYKIITISNKNVVVKTDESGFELFIPFDEANSDYQQYLIDTDGGLPVSKESK